MKAVRNLLVGSVLFTTVFCGLIKSASMQEVVRDIHAAWDESGRYLLVVESRYRTPRPQEPYFNAPAARDWEIRLYEVGPITAPLDSARLEAALKHRKALGGWNEEAEPGGSLMSAPLYWLRAAGLVVSVENQIPILFDIQAGRRSELRPPEAVVEKLVGAELAPAAFGRSPAPSPDGRTIAVFYTAPRQGARPIDPIRFKHFVSFFAAADGRHLLSRPLDWPDDTIDMALTPHAKAIPLRYQFLWAQDSRGVFVIDRKRALLVPVEGREQIAPAARVPARAVQTIGGPVSPRGDYVYLMENHARPNERRLGVATVSGWLPFEKVPLIDHKAIGYSVP